MSIDQLQPGTKVRYLETAYGKYQGKERTTTIKGLCKPDDDGQYKWVHTGAGVVCIRHILGVVA